MIRRQGTLLLVCAASLLWLRSGNGQDTPEAPGGKSSREKIRAALQSTRGALDGAAELTPLFERLYRLAAGQTESVHILHFGDSHTAADEWTAGLRNLFQERFGAGGSGFSVAGHPFAGYRRFDVSGGATGNWTAAGLHSAAGDGYFGLGGVSISADRAGQSVYVDTECDLLEIHYLQQPNGGGVALYDNGALLREFSTAGDLQPAFLALDTTPGTHRFLLKTTSPKPVRLFGWVADKRKGVTYEALGLNGARASIMLHWNEEMLATYLRRRNPALIVLAYGTNDSSDYQSTAHYQELFSKLLKRLRHMVPETTILVIGPPDGYMRSHGRLHPMPEMDGIIAAQQNACRENRCAFWDLREHMGGIGSMRDWELAGLAQRDYIHFSPTGYRNIAEALFADLIRYYNTYDRVRSQLIGRNSHE